MKKEVTTQRYQTLKETEKLINDTKESDQLITDLNVQLEESKRVEEVTKIAFEAKIKDCQRLEAEILSLRRKLNKFDGTNRLEDLLKN